MRERLDPPLIHAFNRANARVPVFGGREDMTLFEARLADLLPHYEARLYAYCLLPSHWHLVLRVPTLQKLFALYRDLLLGHRQALIELGRRHAIPMLMYESKCESRWIRDEEHFYRVCRYVERNPVSHGYTRDPHTWRHSSLWMRTRNLSLRPRLLTPWPSGVPHDWSQMLR